MDKGWLLVLRRGRAGLRDVQEPIPPSLEESRSIEARALLEHARWLYEVTYSRVESCNERAGVLLAASFAIVALGIPIVFHELDGGIQKIAGVSFIPLVICAGASFAVLALRRSHDVGSRSVMRWLGHNRPLGDSGDLIHEKLLNELVLGPTAGKKSALDGIEELSKRKASWLLAAQWAFVSTILPVTIAVIAAAWPESPTP